MYSFGQSDPLFSQYMFNIQTYNPAYAGTWEHLGVTMGTRQQWININGAPSTSALTVQSTLKNINVGTGLTLINDKIGKVNRLGVYIDYSYRLSLNGVFSLRLGLRGGFTNYRNNLSSYTRYDFNDPVFLDDSFNSFLPNFGIGTFLSSKRLYAGISIPRFLKNEIDSGYSVFAPKNLIFTGGYVFPLQEKLDLKPSFIIRYYLGYPVVCDLNLSILLNNKFWIGTTYRVTNPGSFGINANALIKNRLRIGYAYYFSNSSYNFGGTHEIMISYEFGFSSEADHSIRYF